MVQRISFDSSKLHLHADNCGIIRCWYDGVQMKRWKPANRNQGGGSRACFRIGDIFLKTEQGFERSGSQAVSEIRQYRKINNTDKKYFTKLVDHFNFISIDDLRNQPFHWTAWKWVDIHFNTTDDWDDYTYSACHAIVQRLCDKYGIYDVRDYYGGNWFITQDKMPLIVDLGCE